VTFVQISIYQRIGKEFGGSMVEKSTIRASWLQRIFQKVSKPSGKNLNGRPQEFDVNPKHWIPNVNKIETKNAYLVIVELPGVRKDSITVVREDNLVRVQGERKPSEIPRKTKLGEDESGRERFNITSYLTDNAERSAIEASYKNGLLTLRIPKIVKNIPEGYYINVK